MNSVNQQIKVINDKIDRLVEELREEKDKFLDNEVYVPDWEEVQKKKVLYESYAEVTRRNDELNRVLTKLGTTILAIKDLKNSLQIDDDMPPRLIKKIRNNLDNKLDKLFSYRKALSNEKDSYDTALRFFNSAQYILGSTRLSGMD